MRSPIKLPYFTGSVHEKTPICLTCQPDFGDFREMSDVENKIMYRNGTTSDILSDVTKTFS